MEWRLNNGVSVSPRSWSTLAKEQNSRSGTVLQDIVNGMQAASFWHRDVENNDIRRCFFGALNGFVTILSFCDHRHIGLRIDQHSQSGAKNRVIVCNQDANF